MKQASCAGRDEAVAQFLPAQPELSALVGGNIGPLESGAEAARTSSADAAAFEADPDDFVRQGVGTFVERFGRDVSVQLNSPVTAIRELPMGLLNKVVFQFDGPILKSEPHSEWVLHLEPAAVAGREAEVMAFVVKPLGAPIIVGFFGADEAHKFEKLGDRAATDYAKSTLVAMYGPELVTHLRPASIKVTHWGEDPWTLGSYSPALPGASEQHEVLARPVAGRVYFAGEACGPGEFNGSLPAAYVSGLKAGRGVGLSLAPETVESPALPAEPR